MRWRNHRQLHRRTRGDSSAVACHPDRTCPSGESGEKSTLCSQHAGDGRPASSISSLSTINRLSDCAENRTGFSAKWADRDDARDGRPSRRDRVRRSPFCARFDPVVGASSMRKSSRPSVISMARSMGTSRKRLAGPARRPGDLQRPDRRGRAQADRAGQGIAAEARPGRDRPVSRRDRAVGGRQVDPDLRAEGGAIGPGPDQLDRQPVVAVARVLEEDVVGPVARDGAAGLEEDVERRRRGPSRRRPRRAPSGGGRSRSPR